jgi:hypothetical protein
MRSSRVWVTATAASVLAVLSGLAPAPARAQSEGPPSTSEAAGRAAFADVLSRVAAKREGLAARYASARDRRARAAVLDQARSFIVETLVSEIFPAWMGMPSGGGPTATASLPHEPGMCISCSYFLTAALQNAGLKLESRKRFAQAPATWIQQALLPPGARVSRYGNLTPEALERRLVADLGDGLCVIGLDIHVGFLVIRNGRVSFVHSSYTPPGTVVDEPLASSLAIANSQRKGYWVSPLFRDDRLVDLWLRGRPVPAPPPWRGRWSASY